MVRIKSQLNVLCTLVAILALAPVLPYLGTNIIVVACTGIIVGFWCDRRKQYPLHGITATVIAVASILFYAVQISWVDVATPVTKALIVLLIIRLLTPKESRDYLQIFLLALFILAASSLVSLDLGLGFGFLTYLILLVFAVILGLVLLTVYVTDKRLAMPKADFFKLVKVSLVMPVVALMLMVVFFLVLPRTRHPMWNFLNPGGTARAGLAESVEPGNYARISSTGNLAFRAEMEELAPEDLYWRVMVLNRPDGRSWIRVPPPPGKAKPINSSRTVKTKVFADSSNDRYLFTLDHPTELSGLRYRSHSDLVFMANKRLDRPYQIEMLSHIDAQLAVTGEVDDGFYLALPRQGSARMTQLAEDIVAKEATRSERIARLANFFRNQELTYAQENLPGGEDPIDTFLFDEKRGYCEFFASAYITLARLSGIPSRLVGGYLGGDYNAFGGYYLVTEDKAHVWVEVLNDENQWIRIDPSQWAVNAETAINSRRSSALTQMQRMIDALNHRWIQGVVLFDFFQQLKFVMETRESLRGLSSPKLNPRVIYIFGGLCLLALFLPLVFRLKSQTPESRLLKELKACLRKRYGDDAIPDHMGLQELADYLDNEACREFAKIYQGVIFRDRVLSADESARLKELLKEI